jgi:hypothetical protein
MPRAVGARRNCKLNHLQFTGQIKQMYEVVICAISPTRRPNAVEVGEQLIDSAVHSVADVVDDSVDHVEASDGHIRMRDISRVRIARNTAISSESIGTDDTVYVYE